MSSRSLPAEGDNSLLKGAAIPIFLLRRVSHRFWSTGTSILTHQLLLRVELSVQKKSKEVEALISVFKIWTQGKNKGKKTASWGEVIFIVLYNGKEKLDKN